MIRLRQMLAWQGWRCHLAIRPKRCADCAAFGASARKERVGRWSSKGGIDDPDGCFILRALFAEENIYRPVYSGTGVFTQEASAGGLHVIDLEGDPGFWGPDPAGHQRGSPMSRTILNRCWVYLSFRAIELPADRGQRQGHGGRDNPRSCRSHPPGERLEDCGRRTGRRLSDRRCCIPDRALHLKPIGAPSS